MENIRVSVGQVIDRVLRRGDIDSRYVDANAMLDGAAAHRIIQSEMGPDYEKEVSLRLDTVCGGIPVSLYGRADGVIRSGGSIIIDEIKTSTLPLPRLFQQHEMFLGQAKCYAQMLLQTMEEPPPGITIQLTLFHLDTREIQRHTWEFSAEEIDVFFTQLMESYGVWLRLEKEWREKRDASLRALNFPFPSYRRGQRELAVGVYRTIQKGGRLYVQAPTGIGKTLSTIFPSVKAVGEGEAGKLFYLTAKTVTRVVAEDAVRRMHRAGAHLKSLTIRAKEKICFCEETICNPAFCEYAEGHYDRVDEALLDILRNNDMITPDTIAEYSRNHRVCPYETALDVALYCDLIICDYNHVFDPVAYLRRFFGGEGENDYIFLIDEAHNLADRVREMYTATLHKSDMNRILREAKGKAAHAKKLRAGLNRVIKHFRQMKELAGDRDAWAEKDMDLPLAEAVAELAAVTGDWLTAEQHNAHPHYQDVLDTYFGIMAFSEAAERFDERYARIIEVAGDVSVTLFCLDPSAIIADRLALAKSSTLFSATLTPLPYYHELLGGRECDAIVSLPSPFDPQRLQVSIHAGISTKYAAREASIAPVAEALMLAAQATPGNRIAFFPSYEYMQRIYQQFSQSYGSIPTLLQQGGMSEDERNGFLEMFQDGGNLLGFCVLGGMFSEGIDLIGDRLIGSIIVGVGLPKITLHRNLIREYYNERGIDGFDYAYVYPGYNKVLQAAGRVIRTEQDSGSVLLIDSRYSNTQYRNLLPAHWQNIEYVWANKQLAQRLNTEPMQNAELENR